MIATLEQKRGLEQRRHTLLEDRVIVETRTTTKATHYEVPLEHLRFSLRYQSDNKRGYVVAAVVLLLLPALLTIFCVANGKSAISTSFLTFLWGCIAFMFLLKLINRPQDDLFLTGGKHHLVLFRAAPNEVLVMTFVNQVHEAVKAFMKSKYLSMAHSTDDEYQKTIQWLLSEKIISPVEANQYREKFYLQSMDVLLRPSLN